MKFQAIVTPDGLISSLIGPFEGRTNDWAMYTESPVPRRLARIMAPPERRKLYLYGDSAYHCLSGVMAPFQHSLGRRYLTAEATAFNQVLSSVRISVEHGFGQASKLWGYNSFGKELYSGKQAVAAYFRVAVLLTNCHICLRTRNQTTDRYNVAPPSLEEYLDLPMDPEGE
jgi:hypothetical protein